MKAFEIFISIYPYILINILLMGVNCVNVCVYAESSILSSYMTALLEYLNLEDSVVYSTVGNLY